jgi:hypothetical protein
VARCSSLEEFIAGFARFAESERLFVITSEPKVPGGPPQPFVIQLADGSTALKGVGEVVEQHLIPTGPEGKCGMWLRLVELTPASKEVHRQLLERKDKLKKPAAAPPLPPPIAKPVVTASEAKPAGRAILPGLSPARTPTPTIRVPAVVPPIAARPAIVPDATPPPGPAPTPPAPIAPAPQTVPMRPTTRDELLEKARRMAGPSPHHEERVPPSPIQLPANPLASVDDESLGYFVECMIYEHTGVFDVDAFAEPTEVRPVIYDPTAAEPLQASAPAIAAASPTPVPASDAAPVPVVAPVPLVAPPPFFVPPPATSRRTIVGVAVASVALGLGGGWLLFGRGDAAATATASATASASTSTSASASTHVAASGPKQAGVPRSPSPSPSPSPPSAAPSAAIAVSAPKPAAAAAVAPGTGTSTGCVANVKTVPAGVHVQYGALDLGETPIANAAVPCGDAPLVLTHPRYERVARTATASPSAAADVSVTMVRPQATLTLRSIPPGATFTINGGSVGRGPVSAKVLAFETLHVSATLPGYAPWQGTTKVRGATGTVFARLTRAK